jgi:hypothetical protein
MNVHDETERVGESHRAVEIGELSGIESATADAIFMANRLPENVGAVINSRMFGL